MTLRGLVVALVLILAGCSSGGDLKVDGNASQLQGSYQAVRVVISPTAKDSQEIVEDLRSSIVGQLISTGRFHRVAAADDSADVVVGVEIVEYERVTVVERILVGVFAGRNRIATRVSITDGRSGKVLRSFLASGKSAAHPLSSEAGYADALREVSKEIIIGLSA